MVGRLIRFVSSWSRRWRSCIGWHLLVGGIATHGEYVSDARGGLHGHVHGHVHGRGHVHGSSRGHHLQNGSVNVYEHEYVKANEDPHWARLVGRQDGCWWMQSPYQSSRSHPMEHNPWVCQALTTIQNLALGSHRKEEPSTKLGYRVSVFDPRGDLEIVGTWISDGYAMSSFLRSDSRMEGQGYRWTRHLGGCKTDRLLLRF